jgi:hypothetical protein
MTNTPHILSSLVKLVEDLKGSADRYYLLYRATLKENRALQAKVEELNTLIFRKDYH